ncbi:MAG: hypothetical protein IIA45_03075 [Bacteroidetes bacterium]|nr:hypothetical protein [Bacteroidota bacterium]
MKILKKQLPTSLITVLVVIGLGVLVSFIFQSCQKEYVNSVTQDEKPQIALIELCCTAVATFGGKCKANCETCMDSCCRNGWYSTCCACTCSNCPEMIATEVDLEITAAQKTRHNDFGQFCLDSLNNSSLAFSIDKVLSDIVDACEADDLTDYDLATYNLEFHINSASQGDTDKMNWWLNENNLDSIPGS